MEWLDRLNSLGGTEHPFTHQPNSGAVALSHGLTANLQVLDDTFALGDYGDGPGP